MDCLEQGIREHVSLSPKLTATVKGKLSLGAKILQVGGLEKIFKQKFSVKNDEKPLKVSHCYLSTTTGPIAGLPYISTDKIAFYSERSIKLLSPTGKLLRIYYKQSSSRSEVTMKDLISGNVVGVPMSSAVCSFEMQPKRLLSLSSCQDHIPSATSKILSKLKQRKSVISKMNKLGERMGCLAQGICEHVSLSPKLTETVKGKLSLGAKILQVGGLEKIFRQKFSVRDDEKLLKVSQCYLSTTAGPIAGLLFISTDKIAFCSERSIKLLSPTGKLLRICYKVSIPITKIRKAKECENMEKPSQKYIKLVTEDDYEFWFMGFFNHQKNLRYLQQAISTFKNFNQLRI
ncbi:GEM-like protein 7 [Solanum dulcamara]|uniref:GEM-like protein 7 n=1 Tax=Solanum dulcamara TaxID=45834 RepID=UPI002485C40A|nr:GEM-like protein 7 [Solanum dulcamara]